MLAIFDYGKKVLTDRKYFWHLFWMILAAELALGCVFIRFVPCTSLSPISLSLDTEIDWKTYMQFMSYVENNTLDYSKLQGETGSFYKLVS